MSSASLLRVAAAGSVDDGKSTLIGRLLYDSKQVLEDTLESVSANGDGPNLAHLTDGLRAERELGITIDVAYRYFATPTRRFILADTPGHEEYTRNMVTGASRADVSIILVDAANGLLSQTRRHLAISAVLRVPHVLACVNKMDAVDYDEQRFRAIAAEFEQLARQLGVEDARPIPIAALHGDNVVARSPRMPWYDGPSVLEQLERLPAAPESEGALRLPVQWIIDGGDGHPRAAGQLARGVLRAGQRVLVLPRGHTATVQAIEVLDERLDEVAAPRSVAVLLDDGAETRSGATPAGAEPPGGATPARAVLRGGATPAGAELRRGTMLSSVEQPARVVDELSATACWLAEDALESGARLLARTATAETGARVEVVSALELERFEDHPASRLATNDVGRVRLRLDEPLALDPYAESRYTGSLILVDERSNATVGALMAGER